MVIFICGHSLYPSCAGGIVVWAASSLGVGGGPFLHGWTVVHPHLHTVHGDNGMHCHHLDNMVRPFLCHVIVSMHWLGVVTWRQHVGIVVCVW